MRSKADVGNVESTYQLIAGHLRRSAASSERLISDPLRRKAGGDADPVRGGRN